MSLYRGDLKIKLFMSDIQIVTSPRYSGLLITGPSEYCTGAHCSILASLIYLVSDLVVEISSRCTTRGFRKSLSLTLFINRQGRISFIFLAKTRQVYNMFQDLWN